MTATLWTLAGLALVCAALLVIGLCRAAAQVDQELEELMGPDEEDA